MAITELIFLSGTTSWLPNTFMPNCTQRPNLPVFTANCDITKYSLKALNDKCTHLISDFFK